MVVPCSSLPAVQRPILGSSEHLEATREACLHFGEAAIEKMSDRWAQIPRYSTYRALRARSNQAALQRDEAMKVGRIGPSKRVEHLPLPSMR
jgi:hypothetical protein